MSQSLHLEVRKDSSREATVIFRNEKDEELGSIVVDLVPTGIRCEMWHGYDVRATTIVLRKELVL
jgi:hypothetical protein